MKKVNIVILPKEEDRDSSRIFRIENGDTGERLIDFVGFDDERKHLLDTIYNVQDTTEKNVGFHFSMRDIGFWVDLLLWRDNDNKVRVTGTILKQHHAMTSHPYYQTDDAGFTGSLNAFRTYYIAQDEHTGTPPEAVIIFE
jgi:hypothetical protein